MAPSDKDILDKVHVLEKVSSSSSERTCDQPAINVGDFDTESDEVDQFIDDYIDHKKQYALSSECLTKANEIFDLFQKNENDLVNEE